VGGKVNRDKVGKKIKVSKGLKYLRNGVRDDDTKEIVCPTTS
jgi:hypothetical protein